MVLKTSLKLINKVLPDISISIITNPPVCESSILAGTIRSEITPERKIIEHHLHSFVRVQNKPLGEYFFQAFHFIAISASNDGTVNDDGRYSVE